MTSGRQSLRSDRTPCAKAVSLRDRIEANIMPVPFSGCWIWMGACYRFGHGQIVYLKKHLAAHRAAWVVFRGAIPEGKHVLHKCNVPSCVNPDHLYIGSDLENCRDRIETGTQANPPHSFGEDHPSAKLTLAQAREIKFSRGIPHKDLMQKFGISTATISAIRCGKNWPHA